MIEPLRFGPAPKPDPEKIEIRILTDGEVASLAPDFAAEGAPMPTPPYTAVGIVADGKIVGYQFLQLKVHVQPTKINKGYAHMFKALCRKTEDVLKERVGSVWTYVFTKPGRMAALAESVGMEVEPWVVMSKFVTNQTFIPEPLVPLESALSESETGPHQAVDLETIQTEGAVQ